MLGFVPLPNLHKLSFVNKLISGSKPNASTAITYHLSFILQISSKKTLADQVGQFGHGDGLAGAQEGADLAVPAVIPVFHVGVPFGSDVQHIHGAHVDADAAFVAFVAVDLDPGIAGFFGRISSAGFHGFIPFCPA